MSTIALSLCPRHDATPPSANPGSARQHLSNAESGHAKHGRYGNGNRRNLGTPSRPGYVVFGLLMLVGAMLAAELVFSELSGIAGNSNPRAELLAFGMLAAVCGLASFQQRRFGPQAEKVERTAAHARRPASYARCSSVNRRKSSVDEQQRECREKAESLGHSIATELEFADRAIAGGVFDREGLNALIAAIRTGRVSTVYVCSLSRLSRDLNFTLALISEFARVHGVRVISISDGIDTAQDNWDLVTASLATRHAT